MYRTMTVVLVIAFAPLALTAEPKAKPDPVARDLKALDGKWEVESHEINGKKAVDAGYYSPKTIVIADGKMDLYAETPDRPIEIDPTKTPKAIDVYIPGAMKAKAHEKGIYALDGDKLTICLPLSTERERPAKFSSADFHSLFVLRRMK